MTNSATLINQNSGNVEWYTPPYIIEAARRVMGSIDLDPASCEIANRTVKADCYFTQADNGLALPWVAETVWLNHPFGDSEKACKADCKKKTCAKRGHCIAEDKSGNADWIGKLVGEYKAGNFGQACGVCFASTSEAWFQPLYEYTLCFIHPRLNYLDAQGAPVNGVTKGSVVYYLGQDRYSFMKHFKQFGKIMMPAMY